MNRKLLAFLCAFCVSFTVLAQAAPLKLSVRRLRGYGGGDQIQGSFRMELIDPPPLASVTFKVDDSVVAVVTAPPFRTDFDTGSYALGWHDLSATGQTPDGQTLNSEVRRLEFVSPEAGWAVVRNIIIPLISVVGAAMVIGVGFQLWLTFTGRRSSLPLGAPHKYGLLGGGVCPKCRRPFSLHWWSFNAVGGKFDRCDHCGKWSLVKRASREQLAEAEAAELAMAGSPAPVSQVTAEEKLKRLLEESRFDDG
jgi:Zn ribbon nucleic-acid-binding protein